MHPPLLSFQEHKFRFCRGASFCVCVVLFFSSLLRCAPGAVRCSSDGDCAPGQRCLGQRCQAREVQGDSLSEAGERASERAEFSPEAGPEGPSEKEAPEQEDFPEEERCREGERSCYSGPVGTRNVGACRSGTQRCQKGSWGPCTGEVHPQPESCNGKDDDCDGERDEGFSLLGQRCQRGKGGCQRRGIMRCQASGQGALCSVKALPGQEEVCGDGLDNDCDGSIDEPPSCQCNPGETQPCYSGPASAPGQGPCQKGQQTCQSSGQWGPCRGEVHPQSETCDGKDNDCDGLLDNLLKQPCATAEVSLPAGSFSMGSPPKEKGRKIDEDPQHQVTLTRPFALFRYEVTQKLFASLMGYNPSHFKKCGNSCPVEQVNWHEALAFCNALSQKRGLPSCFDCQGSGSAVTCAVKPRYARDNGKAYYTCKGYRLPSEAEWEYAARATSTTALESGSLHQSDCTSDPNLIPYAWYCANASQTTHAIGLKQPNLWGLYDMAGNVFEWVYDGCCRIYSLHSVSDPLSNPCVERIFRGGSYSSQARACRPANRAYAKPAFRSKDRGLRPCRTL